MQIVVVGPSPSVWSRILRPFAKSICGKMHLEMYRFIHFGQSWESDERVNCQTLQTAH